jgi:hypothetical protein
MSEPEPSDKGRKGQQSQMGDPGRSDGDGRRDDGRAMATFDDDQLKYPSRDGTYLSQLYNQPIVTTLSSFSQVANLVRNPYELINNVDEFVRHASGNNKRKMDRSNENIARVLNQNRHSLTPVRKPQLQELDTFAAHHDQSDTQTHLGDSNGPANQPQTPIPVIPPIDASNKRGRLDPLTIEEYENKFRQSATDLELIERIFAGSMACNQLRAALWPYLFGLILHRGKFDKFTGPNGEVTYLFVEHEANNSRWRELKSLYETYHAQWTAILPDQESRFSTFRERKSLIERDVIRCDRLHPFYAEEPQNLSKLTHLLMTYMMYDFDIGYVQGMSDIAGPILYMYSGDLVKSFWVFVEVMKLFRRNFELTQKTIHFQLSCLYELVKNTDPVFAQYLEENDSSNCFFAFRAIVCQFKRELMKEDEDDYSKVLFLWDTIWCVARRCALKEEMDKLTTDIDMEAEGKGSDSQWKAVTEQPTQSDDNPFAISVDPNQADSLRYKLTETEIFVLALCLSMIRRERDLVMANKMDATDIHLHFIDPKLATDLNSFIEHAINIYSYLKNDFDLSKLTSPPKQSTQQSQESAESFADASPGSADDSLSDFLIINGAS